MSPSESALATPAAPGLAAATARVTQEARNLAVNESLETVSPDQLRALLSATVQLYAAFCEHTGTDLDPLESEVPATDAVVLACALLKARDLNPFDLALWFSRSRSGA
jgi:hypothetical protein